MLGTSAVDASSGFDPIAASADCIRFLRGTGPVPFTVHADPADPQLVWFALFQGAGRLDVYWPEGYGVRFGDPPTVIAPDGEVLFHDGEFVTQSYPVCNGPGRSVIWHTSR